MGTPLDGCSAIIGPDGRVLSTAKTGGEELLIADLNLADATKAKLFADASGHCKNPSLQRNCRIIREADFHCADSRPDLLWLGADPTRKTVVRVQKKAEDLAEAEKSTM